MIDIEDRGSRGYLITGVILGIALGLMTAWYWYPVQRIDTHPSTLRDDFKGNYREMIAAAFAVSGDLGRAKSRLTLLQDTNPIGVISSQAQISMAAGGSEDSARALGLLAAALSIELTPTALGGAVGTMTPGSVNPEITGEETNDPAMTITGTAGVEITPTVTNTPPFTPTATATQGAAFTMDSFNPVCDPDLPGPLLQVYVFDAARRPVPGVEVVVTWEGGSDVFYTGLKPEIDLGYADFTMESEIQYTVGLTLGDQPASGFAIWDCETEEGEQVLGSWEIIFVQP